MHGLVGRVPVRMTRESVQATYSEACNLARVYQRKWVCCNPTDCLESGFGKGCRGIITRGVAMLVPPAWMDCCCCCMLHASCCKVIKLHAGSAHLDRSKTGTCCTTEHGMNEEFSLLTPIGRRAIKWRPSCSL